MECKLELSQQEVEAAQELIDTLWNVNLCTTLDARKENTN